MNGVLKSFGSVLLFVSVMNMDGVLKNCGSVIVFCEYNESVVDVYWNKLGRLSMVMERRERN